VPVGSGTCVGPAGRLGPPGGPTVGAVPGPWLTRKSPGGRRPPVCAEAGAALTTETRTKRGANHLMVASILLKVGAKVKRWYSNTSKASLPAPEPSMA